jgi:hypothetical protein
VYDFHVLRVRAAERRAARHQRHALAEVFVRDVDAELLAGVKRPQGFDAAERQEVHAALVFRRG